MEVETEVTENEDGEEVKSEKIIKMMLILIKV
jgi:hypothetical protein